MLRKALFISLFFTAIPVFSQGVKDAATRQEQGNTILGVSEIIAHPGSDLEFFTDAGKSMELTADGIAKFPLPASFAQSVTIVVVFMPTSNGLNIKDSTNTLSVSILPGSKILANLIKLVSPDIYYNGQSEIRTNGSFTAQGQIRAGTRDFSSLPKVKVLASSGHSGTTPTDGARELVVESNGTQAMGQSFLFPGGALSDVWIIGSSPTQQFVFGWFYDWDQNRQLWSSNNGAGSIKNIFFVDGDDANPAGLYPGVGPIIFDSYNTYPSFIEKDGKVWKENIRMATDASKILQARDIKELDKPVLFEFDTTDNHPRGAHTNQIDFVMESLPARLKNRSPTDGTEISIMAYDAIKEMIVDIQRENIQQNARIKYLEEQLNIAQGGM